MMGRNNAQSGRLGRPDTLDRRRQKQVSMHACSSPHDPEQALSVHDTLP
jgi:hypothetical protein